MWYLEYLGFDAMENEISAARKVERTKLKARKESEAIKEARGLWKKLVKKTYSGWDDKNYPCCPRLIYEVRWVKFMRALSN